MTTKKQRKLTKANLQARRNITYHVGNKAERLGISITRAAQIFRADVIASQTSTHLAQAAHLADPGTWPPSEAKIISWVRKWQRDKPLGQQRKDRKTRAPKIDPGAVANARKRVLEYILARRKQRNSTISMEIHNFQERLRFHRLAPDVQEAAKTAHARPGSKTDISLARNTIYSWLKIYENSGYETSSLKPKSPKAINHRPANDNESKV